MAYKSPADVLSAVLNSSTSADLNVRDTRPASVLTSIPVSTGVVSVNMMIDPYDTVAASMQTAAGASTPYQLATQTCVAVAIKARPGNTGNIWVAGASTVSNTRGFPLDANDAISLTVSNVDKLWYWADTAADKVCWIVIA